MRKVISNKLGQGFLRFISILFLIFEQGIGKKLGQIFFKICKYTFCNIWKVYQHTIGLCFFNICKYTFFSISKTWSAKNWNWFFSRFVSTLFYYLGKVVKLGQISFKISQYPFSKYFKEVISKIGPGIF